MVLTSGLSQEQPDPGETGSAFAPAPPLLPATRRGGHSRLANLLATACYYDSTAGFNFRRLGLPVGGARLLGRRLDNHTARTTIPLADGLSLFTAVGLKRQE